MFLLIKNVDNDLLILLVTKYFLSTWNDLLYSANALFFKTAAISTKGAKSKKIVFTNRKHANENREAALTKPSL